MTTKLGGAIAGSVTAATVASRLASALAAARPLKPIAIPGLKLTALLTLLGTERALDLEGVVRKAMQARGIPESPFHEGMWELERARHFLAEAVLDDDPAKSGNPPPIGSLAEWGALPKETIAALWAMYDDLSQENDPVDVVLTPDDADIIRDAIVKKNAMLLRSFGARKLTAWLLTTAAQRASSPTAESSPGPTSSASSD